MDSWRSPSPPRTSSPRCVAASELARRMKPGSKAGRQRPTERAVIAARRSSSRAPRVAPWPRRAPRPWIRTRPGNVAHGSARRAAPARARGAPLGGEIHQETLAARACLLERGALVVQPGDLRNLRLAEPAQAQPHRTEQQKQRRGLERLLAARRVERQAERARDYRRECQ